MCDVAEDTGTDVHMKPGTRRHVNSPAEIDPPSRSLGLPGLPRYDPAKPRAPPLARTCIMRAIVALITLTIASLALIGCTDDECTLACPADQVCVVDSGLELCRDTCGGAVCSAGQACVDGACVADQSCSTA